MEEQTFYRRKITLNLKLLNLIKEEIPVDRICFLSVIDGKLEIEDKDSSFPVKYKQLQEKIAKKAMEDKIPLLIPDVRLNTGLLPYLSPGNGNLKSLLCLPLMVKNNSGKVLFLERSEKFPSFSHQEIELLIALSQTFNFLLKNNSKRAVEESKFSSDPLLIGKSPPMKEVFNLIEKVKDIDTPVLIQGESGTGKEVVARNIYSQGKRRKGKFVPLNCGAVPDFLLESELFGYIKGAFTGAIRNKPGLIEEAEGGTFFLDEIGDLSPHLQAKLLRVLQDKEIRRIGENRTRQVNTRFLSATNKNIEKEIQREKFREDLYYRLNIINIYIPPLRKRKEDIMVLVNHFLDKYSLYFCCSERPFFSPGALELLMNYSWPGNVRELQNEVQRCLILSKDNGLIKEEYLSPKINPKGERNSGTGYNFFRAKAEFEKRFLHQALARYNYNKTQTAEKIGLSRQGLFKLIKKHKIYIPSKC